MNLSAAVITCKARRLDILLASLNLFWALRASIKISEPASHQLPARKHFLSAMLSVFVHSHHFHSVVATINIYTLGQQPICSHWDRGRLDWTGSTRFKLKSERTHTHTHTHTHTEGDRHRAKERQRERQRKKEKNTILHIDHIKLRQL